MAAIISASKVICETSAEEGGYALILFKHRVSAIWRTWAGRSHKAGRCQVFGGLRGGRGALLAYKECGTGGEGTGVGCTHPSRMPQSSVIRRDVCRMREKVRDGACTQKKEYERLCI